MKSSPIPEGYRRNVAIIVLNEAGKLLACERSDVSNAWQLPQGGIDEGEPLDVAMRRELAEEIGTAAVEEIASLPEPIRYEWPEDLYARGFRGQEQHYFLVRILPGVEFNLDAHHQKEFQSVRWMGREEFLSKLTGFKAEAYREAIRKFDELFPRMMAP